MGEQSRENGALRRGFALAGTVATLIATGLISAPSVVAAAPNATKPTAVSLASSDPRVTTSTKQAIYVEVGASNDPSTPASDGLEVTLSKGKGGNSETHTWTFPITSSVLDVSSSGKGTLKVPSSKISPFGAVDLTISPVGKMTSMSCQGKITSKSVAVKLSGTFFFNSKSTGPDSWGTFGSKKHAFTFPAKNRVIWLYPSPGEESCASASTPCGPSLFWTAQQGNTSFDGTSTSKSSSLFASKTASLSKPTRAARIDTNGVSTKTPVITTDQAGGATLSVQASGGAGSGSATITSGQPGSSFPAECGNGNMQKTEFWNGPYSNGSPTLSVSEQIYGPISIGTGSDGSFGTASAS